MRDGCVDAYQRALDESLGLTGFRWLDGDAYDVEIVDYH